MIKLNNTVPHAPDEGTWGDCHRVCHAMIHGLDPEEVPHFYEDGNAERGNKLEKKFIESLGLAMGHILWSSKRASLEDVLLYLGDMCPGVVGILGGTSRADSPHSVVTQGGEIFHDPTGSGIIDGVAGYYWFTFFSLQAP